MKYVKLIAKFMAKLTVIVLIGWFLYEKTWLAAELVGALLLTGILIFILIYLLAKRDLCFTFIQRGSIKFIKEGESLKKILYDTPGYTLNKDGEFEKTTDEEFRPPFGIYWMGLPPYTSIHNFKISKVTENPSGEKPSEWVTKEEFTDVQELRFRIPRPFVFFGVEFGSGASADLLITLVFRVVDPAKPVFDLKGKFFDNLAGDLGAEISTVLQEYSIKGEDALKNFTKAKRIGKDGILSYILAEDSEFNTTIKATFGMIAEDISIAQFAPAGSQQAKDAFSAKATAVLLGEAKIATADADAQALLKTAKAEQARLEMLGLLRIEGDRVILIPDARTKAFTDALGKLNELRVLGDGALSMINVEGGGEKK